MARIEPQQLSARVATTVRSVLASLAVGAFRRPLAALLSMAVLVGAATWAASRLTLDPDLSRLLPSSYPSVQNLERLRDRFGGIGYVALLVEGGTPEARRRFADEVAPRLAALPTVRDVDVRRPDELLADRVLWFLDRADLETIRDRLRARRRWQIERSWLDLDDAKPPPVDVADIEARYRERHAAALGGSDRSPYYEDPSGQKLVVLARPADLASDLDFARKVVADVEGAVREADPGRAGLHVELTGRYKKRVDLQAVLARDLTRTSILSTALILGYLALHFRRSDAIVILLVPLLAGLALTYGCAGLLFGKLNVLTAFIGAILGGIGVDHGIHLLGRFEDERHAGTAPERAIAIAFGEAGRISVAAALTSAAAFASLAWTDFRAFREFGLLSALGLLLVLGSYLVLLPPILALALRLPWFRHRAPRSIALPGVARMQRWAPALLVILGLAGALAVTGVPRLHFDADLARLDDADTPSFRRGGEVGAILGRSQTPMVIFASSAEEAREATAIMRQRMHDLGADATIGAVASLPALLPQDQAAKAPLIQEIGDILARIPDDALDEAARERAERLRRSARSAPLGIDDLPGSVRHLFATRDGADAAHVVLLFPSVSTSDGRSVRRLAAQAREIELSSGAVLVGAGEPMVMADILETVQRDAPRIMVLTFVLVLAVLYATLGSLRLALVAIAPAVVTLAVTLGLMPRLGIDLDYLNMIMIPILLGVGVDDGAHMIMRVDAGERLTDVWRHTGWDISGAILTDIFGFGVLAIAAHRGLAALGMLALLGLTVSLVVCVVFLPVAMAALPLVRARGRPRPSTGSRR